MLDCMTEYRAKPIVVVAGQVPPPTGGQNVMIQRILGEMSSDTRWQTVHLPFFFTPSFQSVRKFRFAKIAELVAVWVRFLRLVHRHGRPDVLLYPSGGPQTVPVIRDILLLPLFCLLSRKVVVQFHAAGIADRLTSKSGILERLLKAAYRNVAGAIVMTNFNRCDPESLGIEKIDVIPHRLPDENPNGHLPEYGGWEKVESEKQKAENDAPADQKSTIQNQPATSEARPGSPSAISNPAPPFNILYAGHLYELKGTPQLVEAFAEIAPLYPGARLVLMGEFLPPYSEAECRARCEELGIGGRVDILGVLQGEKKAAQFRAAHLFVFPSVAPYESFGLVMAEAMMWGLPIIATDWRGNRDVAGPDALYAIVGDSLPQDLTARMREAMAQPAELTTMSTASRRRFEEEYRLDPTQSDYRQWMGKLLMLREDQNSLDVRT